MKGTRHGCPRTRLTCLCLSAASTCEHGDGTCENRRPCVCGATTCTANSGLYCNAKFSSCSRKRSCIYSDGMNQNPSDCQCGDDTCTEKSGLYCHFNTCSKHKHFAILKKGQCNEDDSRHIIFDNRVCVYASGKVLPEHRFTMLSSLDDSRDDYWPPGCNLEYSMKKDPQNSNLLVVNTNKPYEFHLSMNTNPKTSGNCRNNAHDDNGYECICYMGDVC